MGVLHSTSSTLEDVLLFGAKDTLEDTQDTALGVWGFFFRVKLSVRSDAWAS